MNRSSATTTRASCKLCDNIRDNTRAVSDFSRSHPAAIASSGLRSIDQNTRLLALLGTAKLERKEMRGGDVIASTTSKWGSSHKRRAQLAMNVLKSVARRHLAALPNPVERTRMILTAFQISSLGSRTAGSSYPRELHMTVTSCPTCVRVFAKSLAC